MGGRTRATTMGVAEAQILVDHDVGRARPDHRLEEVDGLELYVDGATLWQLEGVVSDLVERHPRRQVLPQQEEQRLRLGQRPPVVADEVDNHQTHST